MKQTALLLFFAAATGALLIVAVRQHGELRTLRSAAGKGPAGVPAVAAPAAAPRTAHAAAPVQPRPPVGPVEVRFGDVAADQAVAPPAPTARVAAGRPAPPAGGQPSMKGMASMLRNPGMKEMIRTQQRGMIDMTHGSLLRCLTLSTPSAP